MANPYRGLPPTSGTVMTSTVDGIEVYQVVANFMGVVEVTKYKGRKVFKVGDRMFRDGKEAADCLITRTKARYPSEV